MSGAEALRYLRELVTSVCCLTKKGTTETPLVVQPAAGTPAMESDLLTFGVSDVTAVAHAPDESFTSLEVQNFSSTYWMRAEILAFPGVYLFIPPGGSKVVAFSDSIVGAQTELTLYTDPDTASAPPATNQYAQVTYLNET